jgi:FkbM family methyltransferase
MDVVSLLSSSYLARQYREHVRELSKDRNKLLPEWTRDDVDGFFCGKKFIVCGSLCRSEIRVLAKQAEVVAIVDDFMCNGNQKIFGIPVIDADSWIELARHDPSIITVVLASNARAFKYFTRQCMQWELRSLNPLQYLHLVKSNAIDVRGETGRFFLLGYEFFLHALENADKLLKLCEYLGDEFSRVTWLSMLMYRITLDPVYLENCGVGEHHDRFKFDAYVINRQFLKLSDQEVYIDAGAFTGDTIEYFLRAVDGKFKHIYSFEPCVAHNNAIRARLNGLQAQYLNSFANKITLIEKGLWDHDDTLLFNFDQQVDAFHFESTNTPAAHIIVPGYASNIYDESEQESRAVKVPVTTIDNATAQDATFVKLEIEGAELEAFRGSVKTIERNRPKMSIAMYHKPEDYTALTDFVLNLKMDYRLGFRQHNPLVPVATVLYCY